MRTLLNIVAAAGLCLTIAGPLLLFGQMLQHDVVLHAMTVGMVCWFGGRLLHAFVEGDGGGESRTTPAP